MAGKARRDPSGSAAAGAVGPAGGSALAGMTADEFTRSGQACRRPEAAARVFMRLADGLGVKNLAPAGGWQDFGAPTGRPCLAYRLQSSGLVRFFSFGPPFARLQAGS